VRQVVYLQELSRDARSTEHKIHYVRLSKTNYHFFFIKHKTKYISQVTATALLQLTITDFGILNI
jgi:hypothetical protein